MCYSIRRAGVLLLEAQGISQIICHEEGRLFYMLSVWNEKIMSLLEGEMGIERVGEMFCFGLARVACA